MSHQPGKTSSETKDILARLTQDAANTMGNLTHGNSKSSLHACVCARMCVCGRAWAWVRACVCDVFLFLFELRCCGCASCTNSD